MNSRDLFKELPDWIQEGVKNLYLAIPHSFRFGTFRKTRKLLKQSQWWSKKELKEYQMRELRKLLHHAYKNVKYYRKMFDENGFKVKDFCNTKDLQKLPFLTKDIIRKNFRDLIASNFSPLRLRRVTTGGSSGTPLNFLNQRGYSEAREQAFILTSWERCGFRAGEKRIVLRGPIITGKTGMKYKHNTKELFCSSYQTDDQHLFSYYKEMKKRDIRFMHAHVSSAVTFANYLVRKGLKHQLKAVLAASEKVYPVQRQLLQKAFDTRVFSFYGLTEQVVSAAECEYSDFFHIFAEYGFTELIDENGKTINTPGQIGEIVGTGFNNYVMPLIRYRTGDTAKYTHQNCTCGRNYELFEDIEGRTYEYIHTEDGRIISLTALIFGQHFEAFARIKKMQLYQDTKGKIEIRIIKHTDYTGKDEFEIKSTIEKAVGSGLELDFHYVDDIPQTPIGKHKFLIQKLSGGFCDSENNAI